MRLMTKELMNTLPKLYTTENDNDPIVYIKFFAPWTNLTWYVREGDRLVDEETGAVDYRFFGTVSGMADDNELGYFMLSEMEEVRGPFGLKIERDMYFKPCKLSGLTCFS